MSRIEQALEKAALLRNKIQEVPTPRKVEAEPRPSAVQPSRPASAPEEAVKIENPLVVTATDPHSPAAEEYRKLKSLLVQLTRGERFDNTLMVTSSIGGEGKTITSLNMAITLAQEFDHTVLLVDADLRKPSVSQYLGIDPQVGLSDCLQKGLDVGAAILRTEIPGLSILPSGQPVRNPAELFSSQRMTDLVQELKKRYSDRYIIFDAPPVLPFAETRSLAGNVDGILFVVKEGAASEAEVKEGVHSLKNGKVLGIVYNGATGLAVSGRYSRYYRDNRYTEWPGTTSDNGQRTSDLGLATRDSGLKSDNGQRTADGGPGTEGPGPATRDSGLTASDSGHGSRVTSLGSRVSGRAASLIKRIFRR